MGFLIFSGLASQALQRGLDCRWALRFGAAIAQKKPLAAAYPDTARLIFKGAAMHRHHG
jgi:hypothetical protein